jgi:hypothetical protein
MSTLMRSPVYLEHEEMRERALAAQRESRFRNALAIAARRGRTGSPVRRTHRAPNARSPTTARSPTFEVVNNFAMLAA